MKIKRLVIENFKSIERIELIEPNPFTVFVGPNGSGKSNIFEALEFVNYSKTLDSSTEEIFGGINNFINRNLTPDKLYFSFECQFESFESKYTRWYNEETGKRLNKIVFGGSAYIGDKLVGTSLSSASLKNYYGLSQEALNDNPLAEEEYRMFFQKFSRVFAGNEKYEKIKRNSDSRLSLSAFNLEKVLRRILSEPLLKDEIFEYLELFVPGFKTLEIDDRDELHWFEEYTPKYFTKDLISDGTYNILALLTAVYQSDEPQFLCIEEPENGLNPEVVKELVQFFRYKCEEKGHYIWLNTHSQTLVSQLTSDEVVVVDKVQGSTQTKQFKGRDFHGLRMDEAWLMNVLGGGLPW